MENRESIILDVKLDAAKVAEDIAELTRSTVELKKRQQELNAEIKAGNDTNGQYENELKQVKDQLAWNEKQSKGLAATTKLLNEETRKYGTSLNDERQKLADMQKAYDQLDKEQRESKGGKAFLQAIKEQSDAVKGMEEATGRAQRNVGNYADALKTAGVGVDGFVGKMKAFLANPWAILIGAIVTAVKGLVDAFKRSEDRMKEFRQAFAPLKAVVDVVQQVFDQLAKSLSGVVMGSLQKVTEGVRWLFSALDKLGKRMLNKDFGLSAQFEAAAENSKKATDAEQKYIEHKRRMIESDALAEKQVAELRDKAAQKDKYTAEERIKFIEQAIEIERKQSAERVRLAKERLAYLEAEGNRAENDAAANDELAEARADVTRAQTDFFKTTKELNSQIIAFKQEELSQIKQNNAEEQKEIKETEKVSKASLDYRLQVQLTALGKDKEYSKDALDIHLKYYDDLLALYVKDSAEYLNALHAKEKYQREFEEKRQEFKEKAQAFLAQYNGVDKMQEQYDTELRMLDDYHSLGLISEEQYQSGRDAIDKKYDVLRKQRLNMATKSLADSFAQMGDAIGQYAEDNENAAKAQKAFAVSGIVLNQAQAISEGALAIAKGVKSAAGMPFPTNVPAIIAVVAQISALVAGVMSSIAQAKQLVGQADAGKFATGGVVGGSSYSGDKLIAHVNSGEGIYTNTQANNILQEVANNPARGGIDYELLGETMAAAVAAQPAPVVVYTELQEFGQKVSTFNEFAKI